jgi:hypothetical protein
VLGSGFLEANPDLATRLKSGEINLTEWFNELLRLVYRLIFLMVAEDRNLLHPETAAPDARKLYRRRLQPRGAARPCFRAATWDKHHDRYEGIKIVFRALAHGQEALALPALGGLFSDDKLPHLETARLRNRAFMEALYRLSWLSDKTGMVAGELARDGDRGAWARSMNPCSNSSRSLATTARPGTSPRRR